MGGTRVFEPQERPRWAAPFQLSFTRMRAWVATLWLLLWLALGEQQQPAEEALADLRRRLLLLARGEPEQEP